MDDKTNARAPEATTTTSAPIVACAECQPRAPLASTRSASEAPAEDAAPLETVFDSPAMPAEEPKEAQGEEEQQEAAPPSEVDDDVATTSMMPTTTPTKTAPASATSSVHFVKAHLADDVGAVALIVTGGSSSDPKTAQRAVNRAGQKQLQTLFHEIYATSSARCEWMIGKKNGRRKKNFLFFSHHLLTLNFSFFNPKTGHQQQQQQLVAAEEAFGW